MNRTTVGILTICLLCPASAFARQPARQSPTEPPALGGPKVHRARDFAPTIVHRDFDGCLKRLETEPVSAAVAVMDLDPAARAAADKVLLDRAGEIDAVLRDNIKLLLLVDGAFKPGDDGRGQRALQELYDKAKPIIAKGPLLDQVAAALSADRAAELRRIVREYMTAAATDRVASGPASKKSDRFGAFLAEGFANFQMEVERSAKRVFDAGDREFQQLVKKLDLTPEQESKVQGMFLDLYIKANGKPGKAETATTLLKAMALLTPEQKTRMREIMAEEARAGMKRKKPK